MRFGKRGGRRRRNRSIRRWWKVLRGSRRREKNMEKLERRFLSRVVINMRDMILRFVLICLIINMEWNGINIIKKNFSIRKILVLSLRILCILYSRNRNKCLLNRRKNLSRMENNSSNRRSSKEQLSKNNLLIIRKGKINIINITDLLFLYEIYFF